MLPEARTDKHTRTVGDSFAVADVAESKPRGERKEISSWTICMVREIAIDDHTRRQFVCIRKPSLLMVFVRGEVGYALSEANEAGAHAHSELPRKARRVRWTSARIDNLSCSRTSDRAGST